jgi:hypothetical protein
VKQTNKDKIKAEFHNGLIERNNNKKSATDKSWTMLGALQEYTQVLGGN